MNTFSLKTFFRFLQKNKLYSAINILGFAISLAFVILIADFTIRQLTTDNFQKNASQIYLLGNENYTGTGYWNGSRLINRYPEIAQYCNVCLDQSSNVPIEVEGKKDVVNVAFADTTFFDMFSFRLLSGDPAQVLAAKENVVLTQSCARKLFGDGDPMGREIVFTKESVPDANGEYIDIPVTRTVSGIMEDIDNSVFPSEIQMVTKVENIGNYNPSITSQYQNNAGSILLFLKVHPNTDLPSKTTDIKEYFKEYFWPYSGGAWKEVSLTPFKDLYFTDLSTGSLNKGNKTFVIILLTIGLAILLFAVINYINLTVAQAGLRAREMSTRRLLGANRSEIFRRFMLESILLCLLSFIVAYFLALAVETPAANLLQSKINILQSLTWSRLLIYLVAVALLGIVSGLAPAVIITRYNPIDVVRGSFKQKSKMVFSKVFIVFQNVITIVLIAGCLTIYLQIQHLTQAPLGYEYHDILDLSSQGFKDKSQLTAFQNEVCQLPFVQQVSFTCGTPYNRGNNNTISYGSEKMISFQIIQADTVLVNMLGLEKLRDNHVSTPSKFYLNQEAYRQLGIEEDAAVFKMGSNFENENIIAGMYKDFCVGSILSDLPPLALILYPDILGSVFPWNILIKVTGDHKEAYDAINRCFTEVTHGELMQARYMEDQVREGFSEQRDLATIVLVFTFIAIFIGALGLLAMSTYFIQQRRPEIAVRKVFGANRREILHQLISTFLRYVLLAFVLAVPVIWVVMDWWLKDYSYRITLRPWIFAAAGLFTLAVATLTVLWQSLLASATNPAEAVKS